MNYKDILLIISCVLLALPYIILPIALFINDWKFAKKVEKILKEAREDGYEYVDGYFVKIEDDKNG